jgi:AcrR family transcriptional regulator
MTRVVDRRTSRSKKAFRIALLSLIGEKKYEEVTITEIVRLADYNRGTFYFHYEQKDDLLNEMIDDVLADLGASFRKPYANLKNEVNIIELSTIALFDHFLQHRDFYKAMLGPNVNINFRERMVRLMEGHFKKDIRFVPNGMEPDVDLDLFFYYRVHGIIGLILEWVQRDFPHSKEYMAEQVVKIATFRTEKVYIQVSI